MSVAFTNDLHCLKIQVEPTIFGCRVENKFFTFLVPFFLVKLGNTNKVRNNKLIISLLVVSRQVY